MILSRRKDFGKFLSQLQETNADLAFYTNFNKCYENLHSISIKLHQLNYLVGKEDMETAVHEIWKENRSAFQVLGILIATRDRDEKKVMNAMGNVRHITEYFNRPEDIICFLRETGLEKELREKHITNLVDYVFGVEVGLYTNARKNRSGHLMAKRVEAIFIQSGITYEKEVSSTTLTDIHKILGKDIKLFDFVIRKPDKVYLIEVNFYNCGGSKLNEIARAYTELALKINSVEGYEFIWITDGQGWMKAKNKLEEAFNLIPKVYNLTTLNDFIKSLDK